MIVYKATNNINGKSYIGLTRSPLNRRIASHKQSVKIGSGTYFHNALRKYGFDNFSWKVVAYCKSEDDMRKIEADLISYYKHIGCYNLADGGSGGYVVPEHQRDEWRSKLSAARQGRKPALGMKHTDANKAFFAECNKRKVPTYPGIDAIKTSFKDASEKTGISKTHFYRLRKKQISDLTA